MSELPSSSGTSLRIADRLAAARRTRFVGREAEIELFRSALLAAEPPRVAPGDPIPAPGWDRRVS
ncbi:MAG: hypothetical protein ACJ8J7_14810 [Sulfurifustaceae bacterium]